MLFVNLLSWSLQVSLVVIAASLVIRLMPVDSAGVRHAWWRAVLLVCLILPILQPWHPALATVVAAPALDDLKITTTASSTGALLRPVLNSVRAGMDTSAWPVLITLVLALGAVGRLAWLMAGLFRLARLRRAGVRATPSPRDLELQQLSDAGAEIRYVVGVGQPLTFGLRHPVVLLPPSFCALSPEVQRAVLTHELWHVRRRDWAWVIAEETLRAMLWFHPAIWWLISQVQSTREEVVDELTVLLTSARRSYLEALLMFADQPTLFPAAPFARRRHLYQRMLLISKEAVMSSKRIVASSAAMLIVLLVAGWYGVAAFPLKSPPATATAGAQAPPRDPRPGEVRPPTEREIALQEVIRTSPGGDSAVSAGLDLAKLQQARGALSDAENTLLSLRQAQPDNMKVVQAVSAFYVRTHQYEKGVRLLEEVAAQDPTNANGYQILATYYWERLSKDPALSPEERGTSILAGIAATNSALAAQPDFVPALIYKNLFLRLQAQAEPDQSKQKTLVAEADALRARAMELRSTMPSNRASVGRADMPPPPPPPPPPADPTNSPDLVDGKAPVRVGGNILAPVKVKDVRPEYPADALQAGIGGIVIVEAVIDEAGGVAKARVLRSIPQLDKAALDAVYQWKFMPTLLNGAPVPVVMTVTVNFTLQ